MEKTWAKAKVTERNQRITIKCKLCKTEQKILVDINDFNNWQDKGMLIQRAMPYLNASEREMLISQTCDNCWNELFNDEDLNEDQNE